MPIKEFNVSEITDEELDNYRFITDPLADNIIEYSHLIVKSRLTRFLHHWGKFEKLIIVLFRI